MELTTAHVKCNYITSFLSNKATVTGCWIVKTSTVPLANMNFKISRCTLIENKCSCFKIVIDSGIKRIAQYHFGCEITVSLHVSNSIFKQISIIWWTLILKLLFQSQKKHYSSQSKTQLYPEQMPSYLPLSSSKLKKKEILFLQQKRRIMSGIYVDNGSEWKHKHEATAILWF